MANTYSRLLPHHNNTNNQTNISMKTRTILCTLLLLLFINKTISQIGYQVGYIHHNSDPKTSLLNSNGIQGGVSYQYKLHELIYLHTAGLLSVTYSHSNLYVANEFTVEKIKSQIIDNSISIPLHIKCLIPQSPNFSIFVFTGPTLIGNFAKFIKSTFVNLNYTTHFNYQNLPISNRLTLFWGLGIGFEYKTYYIKGNYDWGVIHPIPTYKSNSFNIVIGHILTHKKS